MNADRLKLDFNFNFGKKAMKNQDLRTSESGCSRASGKQESGGDLPEYGISNKHFTTGRASMEE